MRNSWCTGICPPVATSSRWLKKNGSTNGSPKTAPFGPTNRCRCAQKQLLEVRERLTELALRKLLHVHLHGTPQEEHANKCLDRWWKE